MNLNIKTNTDKGIEKCRILADHVSQPRHLTFGLLTYIILYCRHTSSPFIIAPSHDLTCSKPKERSFFSAYLNILPDQLVARILHLVSTILHVIILLYSCGYFCNKNCIIEGHDCDYY